MKHSFDIHEFSFNKIKTGERTISIHLFDKNTQKIKINDILNIRNSSSGEQIECKIKGIAIFDNFNDLIDVLGYKPLGYNNKEEIMLRIQRIFPQNLQQNLNSVAFFLELLQENFNYTERGEIRKIKDKIKILLQNYYKKTNKKTL